eukprot:gene14322-14193_t
MQKKDKCTLATCPECERVNQNKGAEEYPWIKNRMIRKFMARLSGSGPALAPAGTLASTFRYPFLLTPGTLPADLSDTFIVNTVDSGQWLVRGARVDAPQSLFNTFLITTNAFKNKRSPHITPTIAGMKTFLSNCEAATAATGSLMINAFMQSMPMETLLDIGAGDGNVTAQLGKLVSGPEDLIKDLRDSVVPGTGRIVIAVVLPFRPSVEVGSKWVAPSQRLPVTGSTAHQHAKSFAKDVFEPLGMKAPYLCEGDITQPYYLLHDYIYVLSVPQEP